MKRRITFGPQYVQRGPRDMPIKEIAEWLGKTPKQVITMTQRWRNLRHSPNGRNLETLFGPPPHA